MIDNIFGEKYLGINGKNYSSLDSSSGEGVKDSYSPEDKDSDGSSRPSVWGRVGGLLGAAGVAVVASYFIFGKGGEVKESAYSQSRVDSIHEIIQEYSDQNNALRDSLGFLSNSYDVLEDSANQLENRVYSIGNSLAEEKEKVDSIARVSGGIVDSLNEVVLGLRSENSGLKKSLVSTRRDLNDAQGNLTIAARHLQCAYEGVRGEIDSNVLSGANSFIENYNDRIRSSIFLFNSPDGGEGWYLGDVESEDLDSVYSINPGLEERRDNLARQVVWERKGSDEEDPLVKDISKALLEWHMKDNNYLRGPKGETHFENASQKGYLDSLSSWMGIRR